MELDCVSVGILVADHLTTPIERVPHAGELVLADALPLEVGGCAANAAIDLSRLGVRVGVAGCVGGDAFGRYIIDELHAAGVDTRAIRQIDDVGTSGTLIVNVRGEDRRFIHAVGANGAMCVDYVPLDQVRNAKVVYVGGYLLMPEFQQETFVDLFREARAAGTTTVLDIVLAGGNYWPRLEQVLAETDVFLPNRDEAAVITGLTDPVAQAQAFLDAGAGMVVVTCGEDGAVLLSRGERLRAGVYPIEYVGGTGAGDAFDAGFIAGILAERPPRQCLEWGSALGASCVRAVGATEGVFKRHELEAFVGRHALRVDPI